MGLTDCLFFSDIPNKEHPHFAVIVFELDNQILIIPISSIKFKKNGKMSYDNQKCKYYDSSCVITEKDIPEVITKPSFVRYQWAQLIKSSDILKKQSTHNFKYKCVVSDELLVRILNGAIISKELSEQFKVFISDKKTPIFSEDEEGMKGKI
jgi:hypothetical protein